MDFRGREQLLRRIMSGKLYGKITFQHQDYSIIFHDANLDVLTESDFIYNQSFSELSSIEGSFTLEQSYKVLEENSIWTNSMEKEMAKLNEEISELKIRLNKLTFNKKEQLIARESLKIKRIKYNQLYNTKNQLWRSTVEYIADRNRKRFLISKCLKKIDKQEVLDIPMFIDSLIVYIYEDNNISEDSIRELARTNPWRLYWTASKTIGGSLFKNSISELTELQYILIAWSKTYDFAYENTNRPSEEVINDNDKFDAWYKEECDRIDKEIKKNEIDSKIGDVSGQEVFIPADEEGAKEVYNLNDMNAKMKIAQRQKVIQEKGIVLECDLPDVKREIQMEANRLATRR
jgi:hypothetical protein